MARKWKDGLLAVVVLALVAVAQAAPPTAAMLAGACDACHGTAGVSAGPGVPSLAGQSKAYFVATMKRYKSGERPSTVMGRLAKGYSDADFEAMGTLYARQKPVRQSGPVDAGLVEKGKLVFYKQCKTCHLDYGRLWTQFHQWREYDKECRHCHADYGNDTADDIPMIAGQWLEYLEIQMDEFRNGTHKMSKRKAEKMKRLSREDLKAVAHFYASQTAEVK